MSAADILVYLALGAIFGYGVGWALCKLISEDAMNQSKSAQFEDDAALMRRELSRYRRHIYAGGAILFALAVLLMVLAAA